MIPLAAAPAHRTRPVAGFQLRDDVFWIDAPDGTARLLDLRSRFYALTRTAADMLALCVKVGVDGAAEIVAERYGIDPARAQADMEQLLNNLQRQKLITAGIRTPRKDSGKGRFTRCLTVTIRRLLAGNTSLPAKAGILLTAARISFALWGWSRTVQLWSRLFPLSPATNAAGTPTVEGVDQAVRQAAARHLLRVNCKERALCCWALLRLAGCPNRLVMGINLMPLLGHAWCEVDGQIVSDFASHCSKFTQVAVYE